MEFAHMPLIQGYSMSVKEWSHFLKSLASRGKWNLITSYLAKAQQENTLHRLEAFEQATNITGS